MTLDAASAVAALVAAKEIEALEDAIAKASFLDNTPGEDRQKLRGEAREGPTGRFSLGCRRGLGARDHTLPAGSVRPAAARTRLKKMKAEAAAKAGTADAKTPVERSPHAKEVRC